MDRTQVRVLEQAHHVALRRFLNRQDCLRLEPQISFHLLGDLTHEPLERQLAQQELSRLLELANLTEGDRAGPEPMRLLDSTL